MGSLPPRQLRRGEHGVADGAPALRAPPDGDGQARVRGGRLFAARDAADEAADVVAEDARDDAARGVCGLKPRLLVAQQVEHPARVLAFVTNLVLKVGGEGERVAEVFLDAGGR